MNKMFKNLILKLGAGFLFLMLLFDIHFIFHEPFVKSGNNAMAISSGPNCTDHCKYFIGEICSFTHTDENGAKQIITCIDHDEDKRIGAEF